ncbi:hypothetical protein AB0D13_38915 [Streptomyces sp. NPDC048430]|uniref:hypothetical protein n=1 Tax=Streptomyces sp. NPDC048430 TaxID=3155388 RepID=UPI0034224D21
MSGHASTVPRASSPRIPGPSGADGGIVPGTEWAAYHDELAEAFGLRIDAIGPHFGTAALLDAPADSDDPATLVGAGDRYVRPAGHDLRRIPVRDPAPVRPHALVRRRSSPHPGARGPERVPHGGTAEGGGRAVEAGLVQDMSRRGHELRFDSRLL